MLKYFFTKHRKMSIILRGENFVINKDGVDVKYGFITTRTVRALSLEEAEEIAVNLVKNDADLMGMLSEQDWENPPTIYLEEAYIVSFWEKLGGKGYTFYQM